MPIVTIHRGTHTIGGTCIEVRSANTRIILDLGTPLMERDGAEVESERLSHPSIENGILPNVPGLYKKQTPDIDAVVISHTVNLC